ncbi:MAG TPA: hypothetical protein VFR67_15825 [Pilimelia sp.]|nr:hypothetical protein [Pilimelia sp.]
MTVVMEQAGEYFRLDRGPLPPRQFVLVIDRLPGPDELAILARTASFAELLWDPGSATVRLRFDVTAPTLVESIVSAVRRVEAAGLRAVRVDAHDWVTLGDIAERIGRSRETVRLWATGRLGPGGFPPPLNPGRDTSFYSWAEVLPWLRHRLGFDMPDEEPVLSAANLALQLRGLASRIRRIDLLRELASE